MKGPRTFSVSPVDRLYCGCGRREMHGSDERARNEIKKIVSYPEHSIKFGGVMIMMMMLILRSVRITFMSSLVATSLVGEIQVRMTKREIITIRFL